MEIGTMPPRALMVSCLPEPITTAHGKADGTGTLTYHWSRTQKAAKPAALSSTSSQMYVYISRMCAYSDQVKVLATKLREFDRQHDEPYTIRLLPKAFPSAMAYSFKQFLSKCGFRSKILLQENPSSDGVSD